MKLRDILKETLSNSAIETLIQPYLNLPLECDGLTRVISYILKQNKIPHKTCVGTISYKNNGIEHYWIKLANDKYIDYRAQMWLGKSKDIPNGIFNPKDYPKVKYVCNKQIDLNISDFIFQILTTG